MIIVGHAGIGWDDFINLMIRPDIFVALTNYQKEWAKRLSFGVRVEKIPDGIDLEKFTPKGEKVQLSLQRPIILLVSALLPGKRIEFAIKAISKLREGTLVILGEGSLSETEKIKSLGEKLLGNRFLLTSVSHDETPLWYRACDIATFPSWKREAFGMVLLEAMACNKPVVVASDPGKKEIVGEAGFFCNPYNVDEYKETLKKALRYNFDNLPRTQAEKFSWANIVRQYEELFRTL